MASTLRSFANTNARLKPTIGDTKTSAVNNDHMGWLLCDGRVLNTSDYAHLFSVLGSSFGGSGSNFYLPAPQGRVPGFVGQPETGGVLDPSCSYHLLGGISGEETHRLTVPEMPAHNHNFSGGSPGANTDVSGNTSVNGNHIHTITDIGHSHNITTANAGSSEPTRVGQGGDTTTEGPAATISNTTGITIDASGNHSHQIASNGGDQRHNNIQPTIWIGNLFIYGGRPWVATPYARDLIGADPVPGSNNYPPQGPPLNIY
jgi:microcystin-dependent protein